MRKLITRLVLPVAIICFALFTKWWYVLTDGLEVMMYGFPFIYKSDALHTSLASHYYLLPCIADFLVYFIVCFTLLYVLKRIIKFRVARTISVLLWVFASLTITYCELGFAILLDNTLEAGQPVNYKVLQTGFHYNWRPAPVP